MIFRHISSHLTKKIKTLHKNLCILLVYIHIGIWCTIHTTSNRTFRISIFLVYLVCQTGWTNRIFFQNVVSTTPFPHCPTCKVRTYRNRNSFIIFKKILLFQFHNITVLKFEYDFSFCIEVCCKNFFVNIPVRKWNFDISSFIGTLWCGVAVFVLPFVVYLFVMCYLCHVARGN